MIELIAMDIDETITNPDGSVDSLAIATIRQAYSKDIAIALISARPSQGIESMATSLGVSAYRISCLGAVIHHRDSRELQRLTIDLDVAKDIAKFADMQHFSIILNINDMEYQSQNAKLSSMSPQVSVELAQTALNAGVPPIIIAVPEETSATKIYEYCKNKFSDKVNLVRHVNSNGALLSTLIVHPNASKGSGLTRLCETLSISLSNVLAIGDNDNDATMLEVAGTSVAVANATEKLRSQAKYVAPHAYGKGVAWAIEHFALRDSGTIDDH